MQILFPSALAMALVGLRPCKFARASSQLHKQVEGRPAHPQGDPDALEPPQQMSGALAVRFTGTFRRPPTPEGDPLYAQERATRGMVPQAAHVGRSRIPGKVGSTTTSAHTSTPFASALSSSPSNSKSMLRPCNVYVIRCASSTSKNLRASEVRTSTPPHGSCEPERILTLAMSLRR